MKNKKLQLLVLTSCLLLAGCSDTPYQEEITKHKDKDALLINVEKDVKETRLYFDIDGNPENAESILSLCGFSKSEDLDIFNEAKIGRYKKRPGAEKRLPAAKMPGLLQVTCSR